MFDGRRHTSAQCVCVCSHLAFCGAQGGASENQHHDENGSAHEAVEEVEDLYRNGHGLPKTRSHVPEREDKLKTSSTIVHINIWL